jgi:hypothetical protein
MPSLLVLLFTYLATQQINQFNRAIEVKEKRQQPVSSPEVLDKTLL